MSLWWARETTLRLPTRPTRRMRMTLRGELPSPPRPWRSGPTLPGVQREPLRVDLAQRPHLPSPLSAHPDGPALPGRTEARASLGVWGLSSWGRKDWGRVESDSHLTCTLPTMRNLGEKCGFPELRGLESTPRRAKGFCFLKQFQGVARGFSEIFWNLVWIQWEKSRIQWITPCLSQGEREGPLVRFLHRRQKM